MTDSTAASDQTETPKSIGAIFGDLDEGRTFSTFNGVFRPTILTLLGVMLYLREGWLVGNAGLIGAVLVILACYLITGTTALSLSSITTNIRVGSGGAFSIISQALGLEVGGSVGIPLYLAQGLSAALYIQGIVEAWMYIHPEHHRLLVTLIVYVVSFGVSFLGARFAFRVQIVVMFGTVAALGSMFLGLRTFEVVDAPLLWGSFEDANFQTLFAVFFPAATGFMVGSSMSGSLKNPRRSIPIGTLSAWGLSLLVYLMVAVWYALLGSPEQLRNTNQIFAVEFAYYGPLVLLGVISSCFSATISSLIASPRVLQALAANGVAPFRGFFGALHGDEPRNAALFTSGLVLVALLLADLNTIAQILTMFFLVIYFMINLVLFIEHRLKMISFRPTFQIPMYVPIIGSVSCLLAILIISPLLGLLAISFVLGIYVFLDRRHLPTPWETVHSGIFAGIAYWAAKKIMQKQTSSVKRSWKPDLLVPVERVAQLEGGYRIIRALISPQGSIQVAAFDRNSGCFEEVQDIIGDFQSEGLFATAAKLESSSFQRGVRTCISVKNGSFFRPNTLFAPIENRSVEDLQALVDMSKEEGMGVVFLGQHPESAFGRERSVNLWIRDQSPDWQLGLQLANLDYAVLLSYQLKVNWPAKVRIMTVVSDPDNIVMAQDFIRNLLEYARMSKGVEVVVAQGDFFEYLDRAPRADLSIFGLSEQVNKETLESLIHKTRSSCLFVLDSGNESALA